MFTAPFNFKPYLLIHIFNDEEFKVDFFSIFLPI